MFLAPSGQGRRRVMTRMELRVFLIIPAEAGMTKWIHSFGVG